MLLRIVPMAHQEPDHLAALQTFTSRLLSFRREYNEHDVRPVIDEFLRLVSRISGAVDRVLLDEEFVRVYYFLADRALNMGPRLTIFRTFSQHYSNISRARALEFRIPESLFWARLDRMAKARVETLRAGPPPGVTAQEHEVAFLNAQRTHLYCSNRYSTALSAFANAVVEGNFLFGSLLNPSLTSPV